MKATYVILLLWLIAIVTTIVVVDDPGVFSILGPVYAICTIGSVVTVRRFQQRAE